MDLSGAGRADAVFENAAAPAGTSSFIFQPSHHARRATVTSSLSSWQAILHTGQGTKSWQQQPGAYQTVTLPGGFTGEVRIPLSFNQPMADAV